MVPGGWVVETPRGGAVKFADKKHEWPGAAAADIDVLATGALRLRVPNGWIIQTPKGGAEYIADKNHKWAPELLPIPPPVAPSPTPSATPAEPQPAPSAAPNPIPPASSGSPFSPAESDRLRTRPTAIEEMKEIRPGVWRSTDLSKTRKAVLQFRLSEPVPRGARLVVTADIAGNVPLNNGRNIKFFTRNWLGQIGATLNDSICTQISGSPVFTSEHLSGVTAKFDAVAKKWNEWTRFYRTWPQFSATPVTYSGEWTYPTGVGKADGAVVFRVNGETLFAADRWRADDSKKPGTRDIICLQVVYAPQEGDLGDLPAGSWVEFSNVSVEVLP